MVRLMRFGTGVLLVALTGCAALREYGAGSAGAGSGSIHGPHTQYASSTVSDEGAATVGDRLSVRDCVDAIGAARGTIVFRHGAGAETTDYVFRSGLTVPENITLRFENGARLRILDGVTVVINGGMEAGPAQQIFTGPGEIAGAPKITSIHPDWWTANVEPGTTDMTRALQAALELAGAADATCRRVLLRSDYSVTDQLRWAGRLERPWGRPYGIIMEGVGGSAAYEASIIWNGDPDPEKAVILLDRSAGFGVMRNVHLSANGKAGFVFRVKSHDGTLIAFSCWSFYDVQFRRATVAGLCIGPYPAAHELLGNRYAYDCDSAHTNFVNCVFVENPIGAVIDAQNAQVLHFTDSTFTWWSIDSREIMVNGIYQRLGSDTVVTGAFGASMADTPETALFRVDSGNFTVFGGYAEDTRILRASASDFKRSIRISGFNANGRGEYAVYAPGSYISLVDCMFHSSAKSGKIYVGDRLFASNVKLTTSADIAGGIYELDHPTQCVIDGVIPGTMPSLSRNALLSRWQSVSASAEQDDTPLDWAKYVGRGGRATLKLSAEHAVWGGLAAKITCHEAPATFVSGLEQTVAVSSQTKWLTAIMTGTVLAPETSPRIYINGGGTSYTIRPTPDRFVTITERDMSADGDGPAVVRAGIVGGETGVIYVDTLSVFPRRFLDTAAATALFLPAPEPMPAAHYGTGPPTVGTWSCGDMVWRKQPAGGESPGWVCIEAGQPGVWKPMANLGL